MLKVIKRIFITTRGNIKLYTREYDFDPRYFTSLRTVRNT